MFVIFNGDIQICTKRNILCTLSTKEFFNEECTISNYVAIVSSQSASVFKLERYLLSQIPDKYRPIIDQSMKHKSYLRHKMLENHIVNLKIPL